MGLWPSGIILGGEAVARDPAGEVGHGHAHTRKRAEGRGLRVFTAVPKRQTGGKQHKYVLSE